MVDVEDEDDIKSSESPPLFGEVRRYAVICVLVLAPAAALITAVCTLWGVERRRVRTRWWLGWAAVATAASVTAAGSLQRWALSPLQLHGWLIHDVAGTTSTGGHGFLGESVDELLSSRIGDAIVGQLLFGVPVALACTAIYVQLRKYERAQLGQLEGAEYSNVRPVGILDRVRTQRNTVKIRRGDFTTGDPHHAGDGFAAVGVGKYGAPAQLALRFLVVAALVLGGPRTGKTRLANSISAQQVRVLGGGALILDFKGGDDIPAYWAQVAMDENRHYLHFTLNEKASGQYRRPHPYAAQAPAFYDPLVRGNGDSKTNMLLSSVDRDGDAAAYLRTAEDVVQLAFDIADLTGLSSGKGGLETLATMLDVEVLDRQAALLTVDAVVAAHPHMSQGDARRRVNELQLRVQEIVSKSKKNDLLRGAINDSRTQVSKFANSSALGGRLRPGHGPVDTIDLVRAVLRGEIIVFSLPTADYRNLAVLVATMVLLDLQNATSTLRKNIIDVRRIVDDTSRTADSTPWKPFTVQVEELGSAKSPAAAAALLGLLNKSSNEGFRPVVSSQGWSDFVAIDGTGVWARQALESIFNIFCFQLGVGDDDAVITAYSGQVDKTKPRVKTTINTGGRWRLRGRAKSLNAGVTDTVRETRVPVGTLQALASDAARDHREFLWVTKIPELKATHTVPEGPNSWFETLRLVTVKEPPNRHDFFGDPDEVTHAEQLRDEVHADLADSLRSNPVLAHVLSADAATDFVPVHSSAHEPHPIAEPGAEDPWAAGPPTDAPAPADTGDWDDWDDLPVVDLSKTTEPAVENPAPSMSGNTDSAADVVFDATDL